MPDKLKIHVSDIPEWYDLTPAKQKQILDEMGAEIDYGDQQQPALSLPNMPPPPNAINQRIGMDEERRANTELDPVAESRIKKGLWGAAGMGIGAATGGAGIPGILAAAALGGATNAAWGPEVGSGRSMADFAMNAASGGMGNIANAGKLAKLGPILMAAKNAAVGGGTVATGQVLGDILAKAKGEKVEPMDPGQILEGGALGAGAPMLFGRFIQAFENAAPAVRAKLLPIIEQLMPQGANPAAERNVPILERIRQYQQGQGLAKRMPSQTVVDTAGLNLKDAQQAFDSARTGVTPTATYGIKTSVEFPPTPPSAQIPKPATPVNPFRDKAMADRAAKLAEVLKAAGATPEQIELMGDQHWKMVEKQAGIAPSRISADSIAESRDMAAKMLGANPVPKPSTENALKASLIANGIDPGKIPVDTTQTVTRPLNAKLFDSEGKPISEITHQVETVPSTWTTAAATAPSEPQAAAIKTATAAQQSLDKANQRYSAIQSRLNNPKAKQWNALNSEDQDFVQSLRKEGVAPYFNRTLDDPEELTKLPERINQMERVFPDSDVRRTLQSHIVEKILSGAGKSGDIGDLSVLQRFKDFAGKDVGGKSGRDILNDVFASKEATRNLDDLYDIAKESIDSTKKGDGWLGKLKFFMNSGTIGLPISAGTAGALGTFYLHSGGGVFKGAAAVGAAAGTVKAITIGMDEMASWLSRSHSKTADVLWDLSKGGVRHSPGTINQVISGLRRRAESEREITEAQAQAEQAAMVAGQQ